MKKKDMAVSFLTLASVGKVREAFEMYVHPDFTHHNPHFPGDRASLCMGMEESAIAFPRKMLKVVRTLEDGDLVAVHARFRMSPDAPEMALVHIFRFADDRIIEEWEAALQTPEECKNEKGIL